MTLNQIIDLHIYTFCLWTVIPTTPEASMRLQQKLCQVKGSSFYRGLK